MNYKIEMGIKKFFKVAIITFIAGCVPLQAAGTSVFHPSVLGPLIEASLLAGAAYATHNWTKHRK